MEKFREQEQRFTAYREKLEYGVYHVIADLAIEAYITEEPAAFSERESGRHMAPKPGDHWGDLFDCGWFHFTGRVPKEALESHAAVLIDVSAEGLLVDKDGNPVQGLTSATSRNEFPLGLWGKRTIEMEDCAKDGVVDCWIDFTCCDVEGQYKNNGRVKEACIALVDDLCRDAFYDWVVCQSLFVGLCENGDAYGEEVGGILEEAALVLQEALGEVQEDGTLQAGMGTEALMKGRDAYAEAGEQLSILPDLETDHTKKCQIAIPSDALLKVRSILREILSRKNESPSMTYSAIGHSHLDLLFLWPERETYRKCARTLSTVMKLMDRFPEYKFTLSQAPVYMWVKEKYPALYQRMQKRIKEKRLEVVGAFFVECDTNLPSGESLVRQLLYGKRFFREEFGFDMRVGFLPDVFGYSAALPQLFVKSGVPYFTTNKLSMNDTNRFPRYTFWWHGLDGSRVLTHMLPENSYTSAAVPQMAIYGEYHNTDKDVCPEGLMLYGLGDGGGGPGYEHMERRKRMRSLKGCPPFKDAFVVDFFDRIAENADRYRSWRGELYFERHQGTYTSMAAQKKWNKRLEVLLHDLELVSVLAESICGLPYPACWLKACWQEVLLYQFHDCLPGSAIKRVYEETQARYARLYFEAEELLKKAQEALGSMMAQGEKEPLLVINPVSFARTERMERDGREMAVTLKPMEIKVIDWSEASAFSVQGADDNVLENEWVRAQFSDRGTVVSLFDKQNDRELLPKGQEGNCLNLYPDELTHWDINKSYLKSKPEPARLLSCHKTVEGMCQKLHFTYEIGKKSRITQTAVLSASSARIDFETGVNWQEEYAMLRTAWPVEAVTDKAECGIQFGHIERPTHRNTSWDEAKFEVCAHGWVDIKDANGGLALLTDSKYGYKVWDGNLDLCLLRSQNCPCEKGDCGWHSFTYAVYPHGGGVWEGGVIRESDCLNRPLLCSKVSGRREGADGLREKMPAFLEIEDCGVVLETVKAAEDGNGYILRFYEAKGGSTRLRLRLHGFTAEGLVNLLEEPMEAYADMSGKGQTDFVRTADGAEICFHAFEIQSLLVRKKEGKN